MQYKSNSADNNIPYVMGYFNFQENKGSIAQHIKCRTKLKRNSILFSDMKLYSHLAFLYDFVMSHVDYHKWYSYILEIEKKYPLPGKDVLEIGGGTASLAKLFWDFSAWKWFCTDVSVEMITEASRKYPDKKGKMFIQDARNLAIGKKFALVVYLYDGINYLMTEEEFVRCIREVEKILYSGGYFLFDITTQNNSETNFRDLTYSEEGENFYYVRHAFFDPAGKVQNNRFDIFNREKDDIYSRRTEEHRQKIYSVKEILSMIKKTELEVTGVWSGFSFKKAIKYSERVHFLLKKV